MHRFLYTLFFFTLPFALIHLVEDKDILVVANGKLLEIIAKYSLD